MDGQLTALSPKSFPGFRPVDTPELSPVQSVPPLEVDSTTGAMNVPPMLVPTAKQLVALGQLIPFSPEVVPEVWAVQWAPPSEVMLMDPDPPTVKQVLVLGQLIAFPLGLPARGDQVTPPSVVFTKGSYWERTAKQVLASGQLTPFSIAVPPDDRTFQL
jgi:hypothetical protein